MRIALLTLLSLVALLGFTAESSAATPANSTGENKILRGTIESVDPSTHSFVLDTLSGHQVTVHVTQKTHFRVDGAPATFADLAAGQKAKVGGRVKIGPNGKKGFVARRVAAKN